MYSKIIWPSLSLAAFCLIGCDGAGSQDPVAVTTGSSLSASSFHIDISSASSSVDSVVEELDPLAPPEFLKQAPIVEGRKRIADIPFTSPSFAGCVFRRASNESVLYADQLKSLECIELGKQLLGIFLDPGIDRRRYNWDGMQYLTGLESLNLQGDWASELDLSALKGLKHLTVSSYPIVRLDLTENTELESLVIADMPIQDLNLSGLKKIKTFSLKSVATPNEATLSAPFLRQKTSCDGFYNTSAYLLTAIEYTRQPYLAEPNAPLALLDLTYADYSQPVTIQGLDGLDLDSFRLCKTQIAGRQTLRAKRELRIIHPGDVEIDASSSELEVLVLEQVENLTQFTVPAAPNLKGLKLKSSGLTQIDFSLPEYPVLKAFDFSNNKLTGFPSSVRFPALAYASFSYNKLTKVLDIQNGQQLEYLVLSSAFAPGDVGPFNQWVTLGVPDVDFMGVHGMPINSIAGVNAKRCYAKEGQNIAGCESSTWDLSYAFEKTLGLLPEGQFPQF